MSCVCILTPVVIAAWPAFSAAVVAASASLGYTVVDQAAELALGHASQPKGTRKVTLEVAQSELVTGTLGRDQKITVTKAGISVTFSRDARGKAAVCVTGKDYTDDQLRNYGEELSQSVVQQYVYQRLVAEMRARQFVVVEEEADASRSIRIKVRHWDM